MSRTFPLFAASAAVATLAVSWVVSGTDSPVMAAILIGLGTAVTLAATIGLDSSFGADS